LGLAELTEPVGHALRTKAATTLTRAASRFAVALCPIKPDALSGHHLH